MKCPNCTEKNRVLLGRFEDVDNELKPVVLKFEGFVENNNLKEFTYNGKKLFVCMECDNVYDSDLNKTTINISI